MKQNPHDCSDACENEIAHALKALGHPVRWKLINELQKPKSPCCGDLCECFSQSQSTISQHLSILVEAGLVECERDGNKSRYSLNSNTFTKVVDALTTVVPTNKASSV